MAKLYIKANLSMIATTIILPAYNEEDALPSVLADIFAVIDSSYEVVVVDDGSSDGTLAIAREFPCVTLHHEHNRGKGAAVRTGVSAATGSKIIIVDADCTYPANDIPKLSALLDDFEFVRGLRSSDRQSMPLINRLGNLVFNQLLSWAHGLDGMDALTGLYGLQKKSLDQLDLESDGFDLEVEIGIKAKARSLTMTSFVIEYQPRVGDKKLSPFFDGFTILARIISLLVVLNPVWFFIFPGLLVGVVSAVGAFVLSSGPLFISGVGLSIHSYIVATLGIAGSFQLIIFGVIAYLVRVEQFYVKPASWIVLVASSAVGRPVIVVSVTLFIVSFSILLGLVFEWVESGLGHFKKTKDIVLYSTMLIFSLQMASGFALLRIFYKRLVRRI